MRWKWQDGERLRIKLGTGYIILYLEWNSDTWNTGGKLFTSIVTGKQGRRNPTI